jgi:hypothetical protein
MKMIVESMMECRLAGETEVLGENLPQRHVCPSQNPTCPPGFEPGPPRNTRLALFRCIFAAAERMRIRLAAATHSLLKHMEKSIVCQGGTWIITAILFCALNGLVISKRLTAHLLQNFCFYLRNS